MQKARNVNHCSKDKNLNVEGKRSMRKFKKRGVNRSPAGDHASIKKLLERCYPLNRDKFFYSDNHKMKVMLNVEKLKELIEAKGIKPSFQRLKILEYLYRHMDEHPTAEMIFKALDREIPSISIATVYNSLNALLEKGLVYALTITAKEIRYDVMESSHHLLCQKCGKIFNIDLECPYSINHDQSVEGHFIKKVHSYFKGICKECQKKTKAK